MTKPLVVLDVPPHVQATIRKVCDQVVSAGASAVRVSRPGRSKTRLLQLPMRSEKTLLLARQTFGSIMLFPRPQDIPDEYKPKQIYEFLKAKAQNAPDDGLPNVRGTTKRSIPGFITSPVMSPVVGWLRADDVYVVLWLDEKNDGSGARLPRRPGRFPDVGTRRPRDGVHVRRHFPPRHASRLPLGQVECTCLSLVWPVP